MSKDTEVKVEQHAQVCPNCGHCPTCGRSNQPVQVWPRPYWPYGQYPNYYWQTPRVYCGTSGFINTTAAQPAATNSIQMVTA